MTSDKEMIIDLEFLICAKLRPTFLSVADPDEDGTIEIVIACTQFNYKSIQERISIFFKLLDQYLPDILKERLVLVGAYSNSEIEEILDDIFSRELYFD
jgi:hypothetical protein